MTEGMCTRPPDRTVRPMADPEPIQRRYDSSLPCGCDQTAGTLCEEQEANGERKDLAYERIINCREALDEGGSRYDRQNLRFNLRQAKADYDEALSVWKDHFADSRR